MNNAGWRFRFFHHSSLQQAFETDRQFCLAILRWFLSVPVAQNMIGHERIHHPWFARLKAPVSALGHDLERVTVQVQRLVEAFLEGEQTCPEDLAPSIRSE